MSRIKHSINPPHIQPWIERVGKLILNFSAIELEAIHWYVQLSEQFHGITSITNKSFKSRVVDVLMFADERKVNETWRKASARTWNKALVLAELRNQIAHNPFVFAWSQSPETGLPDIQGIPNIKARKKSRTKWLVTPSELDSSIDLTAQVAELLAQLRQEWCAARDLGSVAPPKIKPRLTSRIRLRVEMAAYKFKAGFKS